MCLEGDKLHLTSRRTVLLFLFLLNGWEEDRMRREEELWELKAGVRLVKTCYKCRATLQDVSVIQGRKHVKVVCIQLMGCAWPLL